MKSYDLKSRCVNSLYNNQDSFVGIRCIDGDCKVHFPIGFRISEDEKSVREDILLLISTLRKKRQKSLLEAMDVGEYTEKLSVPINSYIFVVQDFLARGLYHQNETKSKISKQGKIQWNKTIKTQKFFFQDEGIYFLDFVVKKNHKSENEMITLIHELCVYESFMKIGWLFTPLTPRKPRISLNRKYFNYILNLRLSETSNDIDRLLIKHMILIINSLTGNEDTSNYVYGTYKFEYIWEDLIENIFGEKEKSRYFPRTRWYIGKDEYIGSSLEPDTIMIHKGNIYILDAKYYKYGMTRRFRDLPPSSSIHKQITYGEYVNRHDIFSCIHGDSYNVYNAFILPFDCNLNDTTEIVNFGHAKSDWKYNGLKYEIIKGILIDTKFLMKANRSNSKTEIVRLASIIDG